MEFKAHFPEEKGGGRQSTAARTVTTPTTDRGQSNINHEAKEGRTLRHADRIEAVRTLNVLRADI
jgi:hypothetical protein